MSLINENGKPHSDGWQETLSTNSKNIKVNKIKNVYKKYTLVIN